MIVVAIIALLASIAIPRYFQYYAKAYQAETAMILASLHTAQQVYWTEYNTYTTNLEELGWRPEGYNGGGKDAKFYYTYGFYFPGAQEGIHYFIGKLCTPPDRLEDSYANEESFVIRAAGIIPGVQDTDVWSINEIRDIKHVSKTNYPSRKNTMND